MIFPRHRRRHLARARAITLSDAERAALAKTLESLDDLEAIVGPA